MCHRVCILFQLPLKPHLAPGKFGVRGTYFNVQGDKIIYNRKYTEYQESIVDEQKRNKEENGEINNCLRTLFTSLSHAINMS